MKQDYFRLYISTISTICPFSCPSFFCYLKASYEGLETSLRVMKKFEKILVFEVLSLSDK